MSRTDFDVRISAKELSLPALTTAHSHAFQRGLRGRAERRGIRAERRGAAQDDFWTWRGEMYRLAESLTPESFYAVTLDAFRVLRSAGIYTVGEFHYVHHQADGTPYNERTLLSDLAIQAAKEAGIRICLLRTLYGRSRFGVAAERGQLRFCDADIDHALKDIESLQSKYANDPMVRIGIAPHSVRAIPLAWWPAIREFVETHPSLPVHMHVAEQTREVEECLAETGRRPVEFLDEQGLLSQRFVAVHAVDLVSEEMDRFAKAGGAVCACPTTERDLGDGLAPYGLFRDRGISICVGTDSHVVSEPLEELRSIETHERLRTKTRATFEGTPTPSHDLWRSGSTVGADLCGFEGDGARVIYDRSHASIAGVEDECLLDALVFSGSSSAVLRLEPER
ncbi:MAG: formimidoylglutamate deiminase [Polyangiaceae bacterium]|nr:formimidoylglutamate deiminase [Polyangiaceae bacterium]